MFLVVSLALAVIYRYGPSRQTPRWRWVTWGSALAALLWIAASGLFSWYVLKWHGPGIILSVLFSMLLVWGFRKLRAAGTGRRTLGGSGGRR